VAQSSMASRPGGSLTNSGAPDPRRWYTLAAVNFALFMTLLDVTVVNVALPNISRDFNTSFANLQWVIATYTLTFATFILTASKLGDVFGRKRLFLAGLVVFSLASLACGLSQDVTQLQIARAVQGLAAAFLSPLAAAIISSTFRGPELGTAFGIYGGVSGIALALGPIIGGLLIRYVNWQSVFFINVPIGAVGFVIGLLVIRESANNGARRYVDLPGVVLSILMLFPLTLSLIRGGEWGWTSGRTLGLLALSAVAFVAFLAVEAWTVRTGRDPMVDLTLFRVPTFSAVAFITFTVSFAYAGLLLVLALLFQNVLGFDALGTGLRYIPFVIGSIFVSPIVGIIISKVDPRVLFGVSLAVFGVGLLLLSGITPVDSWTVLLPGLIVAGFGGAALQAQLTNTAVASAPRERAGQATGISATMRQVGSSVGIALLGAIFANRYAHYLPGALTAAKVPDAATQMLFASGGGNASAAGHLPPTLLPAIAAAINFGTRDAFEHGFSDMIRVIVGLVALCIAAALLFIHRRDMTTTQRGGPPPSAPARVGTGTPHPAREEQPAPVAMH